METLVLTQTGGYFLAFKASMQIDTPPLPTTYYSTKHTPRKLIGDGPQLPLTPPEPHTASKPVRLVSLEQQASYTPLQHLPLHRLAQPFSPHVTHLGVGCMLNSGKHPLKDGLFG